MAQVPFVLYDTAPFGTSAGVTHTLFQVAQGADATHTRQFTNMRASGQLPQNESMVIRSIHAILWDEIAEADVPAIWDGSYMELTISDENIFRIPLKFFASHNGFSGVLNQAAAANRSLVGLNGMGFSLMPEIKLIGGNAFRVDVYQQELLSAAENMWICLEGVLDR